MLIGIVAEKYPLEKRVAASPETVKKFIALGAEAVVESGAGIAAGILDADFAAAGARLGSAGEALGADIVLKVRRPNDAEIGQLKRGALVVAIMDPYGHLRRSRRWPRPAFPPSPWSSCRASPAPR